MPITCNCKRCGKESFYEKASDVRAYCSKACRCPRVKAVCRQCSVEFERPLSLAGNFCSMTCYDTYKAKPVEGTTERICFICKNQFLHYQPQVVTCSKECSKKYHRITRRVSQLKSKKNRKQILLDIFGNKCCKCGLSDGKRSLAFHHIDPSTKLFTLTMTKMEYYSMDKLIEEAKKCILVCHNCHAKIHEDERKLKIKSKKQSKYKKTKEDLIAMSGNKCADCGLEYNGCLSVFSFHHKDPSTKKFGICGAKLSDKKYEEILEEYSKCILLCLNCHFVLEEKLSPKVDENILQTKYGAVVIDYQ